MDEVTCHTCKGQGFIPDLGGNKNECPFCSGKCLLCKDTGFINVIGRSFKCACVTKKKNLEKEVADAIMFDEISDRYKTKLEVEEKRDIEEFLYEAD